MRLSHEQKRHFYEHGFVRVPGVVPKVMVDAARRAINHSIGNGIDPAQLTTFRAQSYCPELKQSPVILDLFNKTPALPLTESAIGENAFLPITNGQIALRFPGLDDRLVIPKPHIDGMYTPTNGVPKGTIANFTGLACVLLSDLPEGNSGNFTVWPGTHTSAERYFREKGPQALLEGMPKIDMPDPLPITGQAGDLVLAHYLLSHGISPNASPNIRYAVFFRLKHVQHETQKWESMTDAWLQWPGIAQAVVSDQR